MVWDFSTEPEFAEQLDWMRGFVREEIWPLEVADLGPEEFRRVTDPLKEEVRRRGLWAAHLGPELGGQGFGQVKLGLMHEILGTTPFGPSIFGNNAPDSGNAELIAIAGTDEQKQRWLWPLLEGKLRSAFSMTEPEVAGSDPTTLRTRAERVGDEYVINGHKWFTSNGSMADFLILMAVTNPDVNPYQGTSMIIVPTNTPGVDIVRNVPTMGEPHAPLDRPGHSEIYYRDVRVPAGNLLGDEGQGFVLAQKRLGPGRIHHVMRWIGQSVRAFDMLCERAVSRVAFGEPLARKQFVQEWVAQSSAEIHALRLMTLHAAWKMDNEGSSAARKEISTIKFWGSQVLFNAIDRAIQVHGALGFSTDLPLEQMYRNARAGRIYDGADEVHKQTVARLVLRGYEPRDVPSEHVPTRREAAQRKFASLLEEATANL